MPKYELKDVFVVSDETKNLDVMRSIVESKAQENAFYILDVAWIVKKHRDWINKMPRVVPYFAVKCNPDDTVIRTLAALNGSFDCASQQEIQQVINAGVPPERIIFANPAKSFSHIRYAKKIGVDKMTVDSVQEIEKIKNIFPEAKLLIRIRNDGHSEQQHITSLGEKFGCDSEKEAPKIVNFLKDTRMTCLGFSFHAGSPCPDVQAFSRGIKKCKKLIDYAQSIGLNDAKMIDIGGGFLGLNEKQIDAAAKSVNDALEKVDPWIEVISEPGRFYVEGAFTLAALVHSKKQVIEGNNVKQIYYINDGCYGSFIEELLALKARSPVSLYDKDEQEKKFISTIWGPTCDFFDCVVRDVVIPRFDIGDWMVWTDMGAYTISLACSFNGFPIPDVYPFIRKSDLQNLEAAVNEVGNILTI